MSDLEAIERKRAERKAGHEEQRKAQLATDLEALDALEIEHGDSNMIRVDCARFVPGFPTLIALLRPTKGQVRRYQDMYNGGKSGKGDPVAAASMVTASCLKYPEAEVYKSMREEFAGIDTIAGVTAVNATSGAESAEGKG